MTEFRDLLDDPDRVAEAITEAIDAGADVVLTGGGNALDPLDPTIRALGDIGAEFVKFGAPAHPGSMFWLAYKGSTPIFSLASCSLYSRSTVADVVLPWIMADEQVELDDMAGLATAASSTATCPSASHPTTPPRSTSRTKNRLRVKS